MSKITIFLILAAIVLPVVILIVSYLWRATKFYREVTPEYRPKPRGRLGAILSGIPLLGIAIYDMITGENSFRSPRHPLRNWLIAGILAALLLAALTLCGGCLSRQKYYPPTDATLSRGSDGITRGAVQEEGYYPWWSEAGGKSFLNPTVSIAP